jgi:ABC-type transport system involved in multi-copper enzyme maturation permease subunit
MLKALLWKEWREQRSIALAGMALAALVPAMIVAIGVSAGSASDFLDISDMIPFLSAVLIWPLFAALAGASANAGEAAAGSFFFLLSRPVSRTRVWAVKTAMAAAALIAVVAVSFVITQAIDRWAGGPGAGFPFSSDPVQTNLTDAGVQALAVGTVMISFAGAVFFSTFVARALSAALAGIALALFAVFAAAWLQSLFSASTGPSDGVEPFLWMTFLVTAATLLAGSLHLFRSDAHAGGTERRRLVARTGAGIVACSLVVMGGAMAVSTVVGPDNGRLVFASSVPGSGAMVLEATRNRFTGSSLWIVGPAGDLQRLTRRLARQPMPTPGGEWIVYTSTRGFLGMRSGHCELRAVRPDGSADHLVGAFGSANRCRWGIDALLAPGGSLLVAQEPSTDDGLIVALVDGSEPARRIELGEDVSLLPRWRDPRRQWVGTERRIVAGVADGLIVVDIETGAIQRLYRSGPSEDLFIEDRSATHVLFHVAADAVADEGGPQPARTSRYLLLDGETGEIVELPPRCTDEQHHSGGPAEVIVNRGLGATTFWRQGRELVYACRSDPEGRRLQAYDLLSGETRRLAELEQRPRALHVAPDGERLWASTSSRIGGIGFYRDFIVDASGALRELGLRPAWRLHGWSGDGRLIVSRTSGAEQLFGYVDPASDDLAVEVVVRGRAR